ncbi:DUF1127 domain-containing protein [Paracoccus sp. M683]|uniref:DUF1127 domain-containing protein n=1 Tax=Paracoccus sp. M683 TaxID=2594268 RepID=UPI00117EF222|nr:DUF1127 domain-containing protein [Paracoccus sp. M683]TRW98185.1 DUF1127 domain-containing protein [Paracoccus sp. M683]
MSTKSTALLRVVTGQGIVPRPNWLERILTAFDLRKTRIDLSKLDDDLLRDIGVTRQQVEAEVNRSMWDAPEHFYSKR